MAKVLAAGLLAVLCIPAAYAGTAELTGGLGAFLRSISDGAELAPRQYAAQLAEIRSRSGKRSVVPTLNVSAGRLDTDACLYQLRVDLRWTTGGADGDPELGGRSLIQKAPCATLADEVVAVALYEVSALRRRLQDGGRLATNQERDQIIAAARRAQPVADRQQALTAVTVSGRVNLRASPSTGAPVLAKLAPASILQVVPTATRDWYQLRGQPGYVHASALQSVHATVDDAEPAEVDIGIDLDADADAGARSEAASSMLVAEVGNAHLMVRDRPSLQGRVIGRLRPGTQLRVHPSDERGWFELSDRAGFVAEVGLRRVIKAAYRAAGPAELPPPLSSP